MGLAASKSWISQGISCGNTDESPILRGRETVLEAFDINCKDMRMLSARTGDKLRAISEVARKGRRVNSSMQENSHTDRRNSRTESRIH
jgi:hypothetical protein